jgi:hypothetical protein
MGTEMEIKIKRLNQKQMKGSKVLNMILLWYTVTSILGKPVFVHLCSRRQGKKVNETEA